MASIVRLSEKPRGDRNRIIFANPDNLTRADGRDTPGLRRDRKNLTIGVYSFAEIKSYYEQLAAASGIPLLIYFFPEVAPAIKTADQVLELAAIENVVGLKFTDYDLYTMLRLKQRGATIFYGRDEMLSAGLLLGADGGIGSFYNVIPGSFMQLWRLAQEGRWAEMRALQARINEFITITLRYPLFPALKAILGWGGIDCGPCLAPRRQSLSAEESAQLRDKLTTAGLERIGIGCTAPL